MRICVLTTSFPRFADDEAGIFVRRLTNAYSEIGITGTVLVPRDRDEPEEEACAAFTVRRMRYGLFSPGRLAFGSGMLPNIRRHPRLAAQLPLLALRFAAELLRLRRSYDIVHANWLFTALPARLNALLTSKPYIVTVRGEDAALLKKKPLRLLLLPVLRRAACIISVNREFVEELRTYGIPAGMMRTIPNGVAAPDIPAEELQAFMQTRGLTGDMPCLLFVGTIIPRKRIDFLIRMLAAPQLAGCRLILCGRLTDTGYAGELQKLAEELGCAERIRFCGPVSPSDVFHYLRSASLYVTAAAFEGRPNAVLEAFAAGCPVLASDIPAHREVIEGRGLLFAPESLQEAAEKASLLISDQALRSRTIAAARSFAAENTWIRCAESYREVFLKALS